MPRLCSVPGCRTNRTQYDYGVAVYSFPLRNPATLAHWITACGRGVDWQVPTGAGICQKHFTEQALASEAMEDRIPTELLGADGPSELPVVAMEQDEAAPDPNACCRLCGKQFANDQVDLGDERHTEICEALLDILQIATERMDDACSACSNCWEMTKRFIQFVERCRRGQQQLLEKMFATEKILASGEAEEVTVSASTEPIALNEYESQLSDPEDEPNETLLERAERIDRYVDRLMTEVTAKKNRIRYGALHDCLDCLEVFPSRHKLLNHRKSCALIGCVSSKRNGPYECQLCGMIAKTKPGYRTHLLRKHNLEDTDESCPEELRALRAKKTVLCPICSTSFQSLHDLKYHLPLHKSTGPPAISAKAAESPSNSGGILCHVCGKSFRCAATCQTHMNYHLKDKPYVCEVCGKRFYSKTTLREHRECVHEQKRFVCNVCGVHVSRRSNIQRHIRQHDLTKQLQCPRCPKRFPNATGLRYHMDIHLDRKRYRCERCGEAFLYLYSYGQHMFRAHGIETAGVKLRKERKRRPMAKVLPVVNESGDQIAESMYASLIVYEPEELSEGESHVQV